MKPIISRILVLFLIIAISISQLNLIIAEENVLILPASLKSIKEQAFMGDKSIEAVVIPEGTETIGALAFADTSISAITLPASLSSIASSAFSGCENLTAKVYKGTYAEFYCQRNNIPYTIINEESPDEIPFEIVRQPQDTYAQINKMATFSIQVSGAEAYIWQKSSNQGVTWQAASFGKTEGNINCYSLMATESNSGYVYRCRITNENGDILYSNTVSLKIVDNYVPTTGIELIDTEITLEKGETSQLRANVLPLNATQKSITWDSGSPEIVSVNDEGLVTAMKGGTAIITATTNDGIYHDSCFITVQSPITSINLKQSNSNQSILYMSLEKDNQTVLSAVLKPDDATDTLVAWSSNNESILTIDKKQTTGNEAKVTITALVSGEAILTAKTVNGLQAQCCVYVMGVNISSPLSSYKVGDETVLNAVVTPENAPNRTVYWTSTNTNVATIDKYTGKLKIVGNGSTQIIAITMMGGASATCTIAVSTTEGPTSAPTTTPSPTPIAASLPQDLKTVLQSNYVKVKTAVNSECAVYTNSSLSTQGNESSGAYDARTFAEDEIYLYEIGVNSQGTAYAKVKYPVGGTTPNTFGYMRLTDLVPGTGVAGAKTAKNQVKSLTDRPNGSSYGQVDVNDTVYTLSQKDGHYQVLFPISGAWKLAWASATQYQTMFDQILPTTPPNPGVFHVSEQGIAYIKTWEGFCPTPEDDGKGYLTIGYGHKIVPGDGFNSYSVITREEADELLRLDVEKDGEAGVANLIARTGAIIQNQHQYDALVSFYFNLGPNATGNSMANLFTTYASNLSAIPKGRLYNQFANYYSRKDAAVRQGLFKRRLDEARIFVDGVYERKAWIIPSWVKNGEEVPDSWVPSDMP